MKRLFPALLCLLAACATPSNSGLGGDALLSVQPSGELLKSELSSFVLSTSRQQGRLVVELNLKNASERSLDFGWAVEWMDRAGVVLNSPQFRALSLDAGAMAPIELVAPHPSASSWRLVTVER
ncbi:MAG: DUF1425 domain-containing protein [Planctomycetes bacterium]|nr:DUF1425 domain-containing protein [Planctomycetota bacterium]